MPYALVQVNTPLAIAELQWATAPNVAPIHGDTQPTIRCTAFTSCIGIAARNGAATSVIGVHLALAAADGTPFTAAAVPAVIAALNAGNYAPATVIVFGQIAFWTNPANGVDAAYAALLAALPGAQTFQLGDGTYGAGINDAGALEITF